MYRFQWQHFRSPAALSRFFGVAIIGLAVDLLTKVWAFHALARATYALPNGRIEVDSRTYQCIPDWLHFQVTVNHGAVFGLGQGQRPVFLVVSILAIGFLSYLFSTSGSTRGSKAYQVICGILLAGVLGNMYDRIVYGYVRDMILALPDWTWPGTWSLPLVDYPGNVQRAVFPWIFNVADVLLCVGVFLMIVYSLFFAPTNDKAPDTDATTSTTRAAEASN